MLQAPSVYFNSEKLSLRASKISSFQQNSFVFTAWGGRKWVKKVKL